MIRSLFDGIAGIYDRMNRLLSLGMDRRWRRLAANGAAVRPGRVLDLACGTGDFAFAVARRFPDAEIAGVDLSSAMLDAARRKNRSARISFAKGDATDLADVRDGTFRLCVCAFGFRNFADRGKALREAGRVLAPGGELAVLEFFRPRNAALGFAVSAWTRLVASLFARGREPAYRYLRESIREMETESGFLSMAAEAGFRLRRRRWFFPCCTCLHLVNGGMP